MLSWSPIAKKMFEVLIKELTDQATCYTHPEQQSANPSMASGEKIVLTTVFVLSINTVKKGLQQS
jgi:hypothetical protein